MKKIFSLFVLALVVASCSSSSDGSREIQIDEVAFVPDNDSHKLEEYQKVSSVFEVVPGKYTLSWRLILEEPTVKNYNVELKLKLRLKKTVKILPEVFEQLSNTNTDFYCPLGFILIDANGKPIDVHIQKLCVCQNTLEECKKNNYINKDRTMDFLTFLGSKPGTEIEVVCNTGGFWFSGQPDDVPELIKNAKGIQCVMDYNDDEFGRRFGTIVD